MLSMHWPSQVHCEEKKSSTTLYGWGIICTPLGMHTIYLFNLVDRAVRREGFKKKIIWQSVVWQSLFRPCPTSPNSWSARSSLLKHDSTLRLKCCVSAPLHQDRTLTEPSKMLNNSRKPTRGAQDISSLPLSCCQQWRNCQEKLWKWYWQVVPWTRTALQRCC